MLATRFLSEPERQQLEHLVGRCTTAPEPQALHALRVACHIAAAAGLSLSEALVAGGASARESAAYANGFAAGRVSALSPPPDWRCFAERLVIDHPTRLTEWELGFCRGFAARATAGGNWWPSPKQLAVFERLATRTGATLPGGIPPVAETPP